MLITYILTPHSPFNQHIELICVSLCGSFNFSLLMTFMCTLCKECDNVSCGSFESPAFFRQKTMCHGFQTVSEDERLGVKLKVL